MKRPCSPYTPFVCLFALLLTAAVATPVRAQKAPAAAKSVTTVSVKKNLNKLPVVRISDAGRQSDYFAVLLSGDGGWSKFDQRLCEHLAANGLPVLGLNSLKYIRKTKTPEQLTADLKRMMAKGEADFGNRGVILIGYSCGANLIPFAYNRLEDSLKQKVQNIVLLSPEDKADFRFHWYNWLNRNSPKVRLVRPEIEHLSEIPVLVIYGDREKYDWCADLLQDRFSKKILPGGHHYGWNEWAVASEILRFKG